MLDVKRIDVYQHADNLGIIFGAGTDVVPLEEYVIGLILDFTQCRVSFGFPEVALLSVICHHFRIDRTDPIIKFIFGKRTGGIGYDISEYALQCAAELIGVRLEVTSTPGKGSTFSVVFENTQIC